MKIEIAIVGGGITGLATAWWLEHDHGIADFVVFEESNRPGGKVRTDFEDGHVLEWGPQGFLDNAPDTLELARSLGLGDSIVQADERSADRFIVRNGQMRSVPLSPPAFMTSSILSLRGRFRVLLEALARKRPNTDETVFEFAKRRIGKEAAEVLVDAMVTGVFAGNSRELSLAATFPRMAAMEAEHGSLTLAMLSRMRERRKHSQSGGGPSGPAGTLTTFRSGMEELPKALAGRLGERVHLESPVSGIEPTEQGLRVVTKGSRGEADRVLLSVSANAAGRLVSPFAPNATEALESIRTVPIAVVMSSYRSAYAFEQPIQGFGVLVPGREPIDVLGTLFCHDIFDGQAPSGSLLLRTMIGGARDPEALLASDNEIETRARSAYQQLWGSDPQPEKTWIFRHDNGISQYEVGHLGRVAAAESTLAEFGIELAGSPYRGVSVNDCIRQAREAARRLARAVSG
jgi:oxygen-dependent protoporphyrinogen oxidase